MRTLGRPCASTVASAIALGSSGSVFSASFSQEANSAKGSVAPVKSVASSRNSVIALPYPFASGGFRHPRRNGRLRFPHPDTAPSSPLIVGAEAPVWGNDRLCVRSIATLLSSLGRGHSHFSWSPPPLFLSLPRNLTIPARWSSTPKAPWPPSRPAAFAELRARFDGTDRAVALNALQVALT